MSVFLYILYIYIYIYIIYIYFFYLHKLAKEGYKFKRIHYENMVEG